MIDITSKKAGKFLIYFMWIYLIADLAIVEFLIPVEDALQTIIEIIVIIPLVVLLYYRIYKVKKNESGRN